MFSGPDPRTTTEAREEAKARVEERMRFLSHLTYYVGLSVLFLVLDYYSGGRALSWSLYIAGVWGVFVYLHFLSAFVVADLRGPFRRWLLKREEEKASHGEAQRRGKGT